MAQDRKANSTPHAPRAMAAMLYAFFAMVNAALGLAPVGRLAIAAWMVLMTLLPLLLWRLEKHVRHALVRIGAWDGYTWMGFIFLFFWIALAFDVLGLFKEGNPDIRRYRGDADWILRYGREDGWLLATQLRRGTAGHGSAQFDLSYPLRQPIFARTGGFRYSRGTMKACSTTTWTVGRR